MCPMCIGAATWYFAGASAVTGVVALVARRSIARDREEPREVDDGPGPAVDPSTRFNRRRVRGRARDADESPSKRHIPPRESTCVRRN